MKHSWAGIAPPLGMKNVGYPPPGVRVAPPPPSTGVFHGNYSWPKATTKPENGGIGGAAVPGRRRLAGTEARPPGLFHINWKICLLIVMVSLILAPAPSWSEFYVGAYLGANFSSNLDPKFEFHETIGDGQRIISATRTAKDVAVDPAAIFGGKLGYWFTKESFLGIRMPNWLKHLGFEIDVSYHNLSWPKQNVMVDPLNQKYAIRNSGYAITTAFLFMGRYGFYKDSDVPFGRLQPYLGVGPIICVATQKLNIGKDFRSTEADLGLAVESGIRYMIRKNISVSMAFRYRYVKNHLDVDDVIFDQWPHYIVMRSTYNLYDVIFGVAYHF